MRARVHFVLSLPIDCTFCSSQSPAAFKMKELPIHAGKFAANIEFCLGPKIYLSRVVLTDDSRKSRVSCHDNSYALFTVIICTSKQFCKFISNNCLVNDWISSNTIQGFYQLFFMHRLHLSHVITVRVTCSTTKNVLKSNDPITSHVDILRASSHIPSGDKPKEHLCMRIMIRWFCRSFYLYFVSIKILIFSQEVG